MTNGSGLGNCSLSKPKNSLVAGSQRPETWHTPPRRPTNTGSVSEKLSSGQCLLHSRGGCILCTKKPLAPLPPTAEAGPDLESIPIKTAAAVMTPPPTLYHLCPVAAAIETGGGGQAREEMTTKILGALEHFQSRRKSAKIVRKW